MHNVIYTIMSDYFISIIVPVRNEENYISLCLDSLLSTNYNKSKIEILVVDGMSTDNSLQIIQGYTQKYNNVKLLINKKHTFPAAVNIGVRHSKGDVIMIAGAHATYPENHITECATYLYNLKADNIGGVLHTIGQNQDLIGKIIAATLTCPFGVGNSDFRTGTKSIIETDTVFGGFYKKDVFDRIGFFNENLISSSDMDFNVRLKKSGGRIFLIPEISVTYYTRSSFKKYILNNFRNGFWAIYPMRFVDYIPVSIRHFIPLVFFLGLIFGILIATLHPVLTYVYVFTLLLYFAMAIYFSTHYRKNGVLYVILMPMFFFLLHVSYGFGSFIALIKLIYHKYIKT